MIEDNLVEDLDVGQVAVNNIKQTPASRPHTRQKVQCPYGCSKVVTHRTLYNHKLNGCRTRRFYFTDGSPRPVNYSCGICYEEFVAREAFFEHLANEHSVNAKIHKKIFPSRALFNRFVHWLEKEGGAHFCQTRGSHNRSSTRSIYLACNRSGFCSSKKKFDDDTDKSRTGPFRVGYSCTAFIQGAEYASGMVRVDYCGDHYGHDARMRLPNVVKQLIAQRQLDGEPAQDILAYLKRQFSPLADENIYAQRICMVHPEELRVVLTTCTRKWEDTGIPKDCEIWEEELLDAAGIFRHGVERLRPLTEKTTDELAEVLKWERPVIFSGHLKTEVGDVVPRTLRSASSDVRGDDATVSECIKIAQAKANAKLLHDTESLDNGEESVAQREVSAAVGSSDEAPKKIICKGNVLATISSDIRTLDKMIRFESSGLDCASLVAFSTRVHYLVNTYKTTIKEGAAKFAAEMALQARNALPLREETKKASVQEDSEDDKRLVAGVNGMPYNSSLWM